MTDLELIFTMLGEASTTEIARKQDAQGLDPNRQAARQGGTVAGNARRELEAKTGAPVLSKKNYLNTHGQAPAVEGPAQAIKGTKNPKGNKA
jgi:hypothetical protein